LVEERRRLERELADAKKALALGGGGAAAPAGPEQVNGINFVGQVLDGLDPKALRGAVDEAKARIGGGVVALVAVNDGRASVAVGVSDGLGLSAVDLVKTAVAVLGGQGGGGRPDMAQGGGPDGAKGAEAIEAVKGALAGAREPA
jgi:alanyl-tRNA synthetase